MVRIMTPVVMETLLHCYYSSAPAEETPAVKGALRFLLEHELIQPTSTLRAYTTTPRGAAHVAQLCALPLPRLAFLDWAGKEIET